MLLKMIIPHPLIVKQSKIEPFAKIRGELRILIIVMSDYVRPNSGLDTPLPLI